MHINKTIEDLGVAHVFEVVILPRPIHIVSVNCSSQLQEDNKNQTRRQRQDKNVTAVAAKQTATFGTSCPKTSGKTGPRAAGPV